MDSFDIQIQRGLKVRFEIIFGMGLFVFFLLLAVPSAGISKEIADFKVLIYVIDEDKSPIPDASVRVMYHNYNKHEFQSVSGSTDKNGLYIYEGKFHNDIFEYEVSKDGYYRVLSEDPLGEDWLFAIKEQLAKGDKKVFILRKVINPIILKSNRSFRPAIIPSLKKKFGYDLIDKDWVPPHGKGRVADIYVMLDKSARDGKVAYAKSEIIFANKGDGMIPIKKNELFQGSMFKTPRKPPKEGYINKIEIYHPVTDKGHKELVKYCNNNGFIGHYHENPSGHERENAFRYLLDSGYAYLRIRNGQNYGLISAIEINLIRDIETGTLSIWSTINENIGQNNIEFVKRGWIQGNYTTH